MTDEPDDELDDPLADASLADFEPRGYHTATAAALWNTYLDRPTAFPKLFADVVADCYRSRRDWPRLTIALLRLTADTALAASGRELSTARAREDWLLAVEEVEEIEEAQS